MTQTTEVQVPQWKSVVTEVTFATATEAVIGSAAGYVFNIIHPAGGAIFGVAHAVSHVLIHTLLGEVFDKSTAGKILKFTLSLFASIGVAALVVSLCGFPLTFSAALLLTLAMIPVSICVNCFTNCCLVALANASEGKSNTNSQARIQEID